MSELIIPIKYYFGTPEEKALDVQVDSLTRDFDTNKEVREMFAYAVYMTPIPKTWLEVGSPVFHSKFTKKLIQHTQSMKDYLECKDLSPIILPTDVKEQQRRELKEAWQIDLTTHLLLRKYETLLQQTHFEFNKQLMNNALIKLKNRPTDYDFPPKTKEVHQKITGIENKIFLNLDRLYYSTAVNCLNSAQKYAQEKL